MYLTVKAQCWNFFYGFRVLRKKRKFLPSILLNVNKIFIFKNFILSNKGGKKESFFFRKSNIFKKKIWKVTLWEDWVTWTHCFFSVVQKKLSLIQIHLHDIRVDVMNISKMINNVSKVSSSIMQKDFYVSIYILKKKNSSHIMIFFYPATQSDSATFNNCI